MTSLEVLVVQGSLFSYQELPVILLVITLSSVIKSLVRKEHRRCFEPGKRWKGLMGQVAVTQTEAGRYT